MPTVPSVNQTNQTAVAPAIAPTSEISQQATYQKQQQQHNTYMQSGSGTTANTQTTKSVNTYASSSQQSPLTPAKQQNQTTAEKLPTTTPATASPANTAAKPAAVTKKPTSNIDLLSDIDFSGVTAVPPPILPEPALKPEVVNSPPASQVGVPITPKKAEQTTTTTQQKQDKIQRVEVRLLLYTPAKKIIQVFIFVGVH